MPPIYPIKMKMAVIIILLESNSNGFATFGRRWLSPECKHELLTIQAEWEVYKGLEVDRKCW